MFVTTNGAQNIGYCDLRGYGVYECRKEVPSTLLPNVGVNCQRCFFRELECLTFCTNFVLFFCVVFFSFVVVLTKEIMMWKGVGGFSSVSLIKQEIDLFIYLDANTRFSVGCTTPQISDSCLTPVPSLASLVGILATCS